MEERFLYHRVPENMRGTVLMPLSRLRESLPDVYAEHAKKYEGRERLLDKEIPPLDCLWNDVLHLTAVHPSEVMKSLRDAGFSAADFPRSHTWYKVPLSMLDRRNTVVFFGDTGTGENFAPLDESHWKEYEIIPPGTKSYYAEQREKGERPFLFNGVPHVFYKGSLDTRRMEIIEPMEKIEHVPFR